MLNRLWILSGLITAVSLFAGGYWLGERGGSPDTKVVEIARSSTIDRKLERDERINRVTNRVTTTKKPDGTVVTDVVAVKEDSASSISQSEREKAQVTEKVTQATSKNYQHRLSVYLPPRYPVTSYKDVRVEVTQRLVGPLVVGVQVSLAGEVLVGLGVEF